MDAVDGLMGKANSHKGHQNMLRPRDKSSKLRAARRIQAWEELFWNYGEDYHFVPDKELHLAPECEQRDWQWLFNRRGSLTERARMAKEWEARLALHHRSLLHQHRVWGGSLAVHAPQPTPLPAPTE